MLLTNLSATRAFNLRLSTFDVTSAFLLSAFEFQLFSFSAFLIPLSSVLCPLSSVLCPQLAHYHPPRFPSATSVLCPRFPFSAGQDARRTDQARCLSYVSAFDLRPSTFDLLPTVIDRRYSFCFPLFPSGRMPDVAGKMPALPFQLFSKRQPHEDRRAGAGR